MPRQRRTLVSVFGSQRLNKKPSLKRLGIIALFILLFFNNINCAWWSCCSRSYSCNIYSPRITIWKFYIVYNCNGHSSLCFTITHNKICIALFCYVGNFSYSIYSYRTVRIYGHDFRIIFWVIPIAYIRRIYCCFFATIFICIISTIYNIIFSCSRIIFSCFIFITTANWK